MTSKGQPTNAVYGFTQTLRKILSEHRPDYIVMAYDSKGPTFRHEMHEEYKGTRPPMPDELSSQIPLIKQMVEAFNVASLELQGYEADDIIATVVEQARRLSDQPPLQISVVTGDKDMYQLIDDNTSVFDYAKDRFIREAEVHAKFGVGPTHVVDMLGLAGDKSDNIPGVAGIGVKTAAKLINAHGTIEEMLVDIENVNPERIKKKLIDYREDALLSKKLGTLDASVPLDFSIDDFATQREPDLEVLGKLLRELEFVKLIKEMIPVEAVESFVHVVEDEARLERIIGAIKESGEMALVALTSPEADENAETGHFDLGGIGVAATDDEVYFIPFKEQYLKALKPIIEDKELRKIASELKPLYKYFASKGVCLKGAVMDISVASYLISPGQRALSIDDMADRELDGGLGVAEDVDPQQLAGARARATLRLGTILEGRLAEYEQLELFRDMELPLIEILASMEYVGIEVDSSILERLTVEMAERLTSLEGELYKDAGYSFNINSPKQLAKLLFEDIGLTPVKKTKTGFSTDESVLTALSAHHSIPKNIIEYRKIKKLKSTYVDSL